MVRHPRDEITPRPARRPQIETRRLPLSGTLSSAGQDPMRIVISLAGLVALSVALWVTVETRRNRLVWDHFDVVKPGILYRSGQLNSDQLADVVSLYGVRTVINFQIPGE